MRIILIIGVLVAAPLLAVAQVPAWYLAALDASNISPHPDLGAVRETWQGFHRLDVPNPVASIAPGISLHTHARHGELVVTKLGPTGSTVLAVVASGLSSIFDVVPQQRLMPSGEVQHGAYIAGSLASAGAAVRYVAYSPSATPENPPTLTISTTINSSTPSARFTKIGVVAPHLYAFDIVNGSIARYVDSSGDGLHDLLDPTAAPALIDGTDTDGLTTPPFRFFRYGAFGVAIQASPRLEESIYPITVVAGSLQIGRTNVREQSRYQIVVGGEIGQKQKRVRVYYQYGKRVRLIRQTSSGSEDVSAVTKVNVPNADWVDIPLTKRLEAGEKVVVVDVDSTTVQSPPNTVGAPGPRIFNFRPFFTREGDAAIIQGNGLSGKHTTVTANWKGDPTPITELKAIIAPSQLSIIAPNLPSTSPVTRYHQLVVRMADSRHPDSDIVLLLDVVESP